MGCVKLTAPRLVGEVRKMRIWTNLAVVSVLVALLSAFASAQEDLPAAEGFIAIAPDLLSGKGPDGGGSDSVDNDGARRLVSRAR